MNRKSPTAEAAELHARAVVAYRSGNKAETARLCHEALKLEPLHPDSIYMLGVLALDADRPGEALRHFHQATTLRPRDASSVAAMGEAYRALNRPGDAADCFRNAIRLDPSLVSAHNSLGDILLERGEAPAAIDCFRKAIAIRPDYERAHLNLGRALHIQGDLPAAASAFSQALAINPKYAVAHNNLGGILQAQGKIDIAITHFQEALKLRANYPEAHFNLGCSLMAQGNPAAAIPRLQEAIRLRPNYARAHAQLGQALVDLAQVAASVDVFKTAVRLNPGDLPTQIRLGEMLQLLGRMQEARDVFDQALISNPSDPECFARRFRLKQELCDWSDLKSDSDRLWQDAEKEVAANKPTSISPLHAMALPWSATQQLAIAASHARAFEPVVARTGVAPVDLRTREGRLKIGYVSRDFYDHPVSHLISGLFALHDRSKFEIHVYSFGPNDKSEYRRRIETGCEFFHEVSAIPLIDLDRRIRADGIHILVDLMGYTGMARTACFALRPAPIQAAWLGYAGTMGADFIDYIIGDPVVSPPEHEHHFSEKIVRLPHSYMVTDHEQPISTTPINRSDHDLPDDAVVFCCFNNSYKIAPGIFDVWMRILAQVPGSVAWLSVREPMAQANLRREGQAREVDPSRLIFAGHVKAKADHLARLRLADLFLDTPNYNAHATTADALWAGLPVLTCPGETFASRVAASLVRAVNRPELIVPNLQEYENLAVHLATHRDELQDLRKRLETDRATAHLFNTQQFVRHLEVAYEFMWKRHTHNGTPRAIDVND